LIKSINIWSWTFLPQIEFSLSTGLSSVNKILSNFNFYIFKPPQPIFSLFLGVLASFFHCYYLFYFLGFFEHIFLIFWYFLFFCAGTQKWVTTMTSTLPDHPWTVKQSGAIHWTLGRKKNIFKLAGGKNQMTNQWNP
jgi:hypothetical protein